MTDIIVALVIIVILGLSILYIIKEKKNGVKCIGCPLASECKKRKKARLKQDCNHHFQIKKVIKKEIKSKTRLKKPCFFVQNELKKNNINI